MSDNLTPEALNRCKYRNPFCPCQDGLPCHYEGENPMMIPKATPEALERLEKEERYFPCKHCQHPGESHDEEFGNCGHLGLTDTGHDICECPGYEEALELNDAIERLQRMTEPMFCNITLEQKADISALLASYRTLESENRIAMRALINHSNERIAELWLAEARAEESVDG